MRFDAHWLATCAVDAPLNGWRRPRWTRPWPHRVPPQRDDGWGGSARANTWAGHRGGRRRDAGEVVGAGVGRVVVAERPARVRIGCVFEATVHLLTRHCYNPNYERGEVSMKSPTGPPATVRRGGRRRE